MLRTMIREVFNKSPGASATRARRRFQPTVEAFEDRVTPTVTVTNVDPSILLITNFDGLADRVWVKAVVGGNVSVAEGTKGNVIFSASSALLTEIHYTGGAGNDLFSAKAVGAFFVQATGGLGDDTIIGGDGSDVLLGEGDNDELHGGDGNDLLVGGDGNDSLDGDGDGDVLDGGAGADSLDGGGGFDNLQFDGSDVKLIGGRGGDAFLNSAMTEADFQLFLAGLGRKQDFDRLDFDTFNGV